eukprot:2683270-Heterocapsa_arctica.AAC.1
MPREHRRESLLPCGSLADHGCEPPLSQIKERTSWLKADCASLLLSDAAFPLHCPPVARPACCAVPLAFVLTLHGCPIWLCLPLPLDCPIV